MRKQLLRTSALVAFGWTIFLPPGPTLAQSAVDVDREKAELRKENADLREMLRLREENAQLRARLQQLERSAPPAAAPVHFQGATPPAPPQPTPPVITAGAGAPVNLSNLYDADVPVPAYKAPPPLAVYNWTGFYVGGNFGYGVSNNRAGQTLTEAVGGTVANFADEAVTPAGLLGGVQLGYNWHAGRHWLVGFETDFQAASQQAQVCTFECVNGIGGGTVAFTIQQQLQYFGTARARLGVVNDYSLFYVTGGGAYGRVNETVGVNASVAPTIVSATSATTDNMFGWVAGAGIETALGGNWTAKVEYLHMDLGSVTPDTLSFTSMGLTATLATTSSFRDEIVRAGINYRFGDEATAAAYGRGGVYDVVADAAPYGVMHRWTGFYAGVNAGYGQANDPIAQSLGSLPPALPSSATSIGSSAVAPNGFAGGGQVGYNWQGGHNWLVGFEADVQGTNQSDTACGSIVCIPNEVFTVQQNLDYFATLRGRIGLVNNDILYYATGGGALGHVTEMVNANFSGAILSNSAGANLMGWVIGGGVETPLWDNWTVKAEYLYLDLGSFTNTFSDPSLLETVTTSSSVRDNIFRAGVNYRLGG